LDVVRTQSRLTGIQAEGGILEVSEGGHPIFMGKGGQFDDLFGEASFFIEDMMVS
jgi:hypothetical protein